MLPVVVGGGFLLYKFFKDVDESVKLDDRAREKIAKAYEREAEANRLVKLQAEKADQALKKVVNRKKGIMSTSMKQFVELYDKIGKIQLLESKDMIILNGWFIGTKDVAQIRTLAVKAAAPMGDRELLVSLLTGGIGGTMKKDSERKYSQASRQLRAANTAYSQAENICKELKLMIVEADGIADVLAKLNALFLMSMKKLGEIIERNGDNRKAYTADDRKAVMTCMNVAAGIKGIIDAPVLNDNGAISSEIRETIRIGNDFLNGVQNL